MERFPPHISYITTLQMNESSKMFTHTFNIYEHSTVGSTSNLHYFGKKMLVWFAYNFRTGGKD